MELNRIYNENCLETMARMPAGYVDLIVTSPPYNKAGLEGFVRKRHGRDSWSAGRNIEYGGDAGNDFIPEPDYQQWQITVLNECHRILKDGGSLFYNHKNRVKDYVIYSPLEWLLKTRFKLRQEITWLRNNSPALAPIRFLSNTEKVYWLFKGDKPEYFNPESLPFGEVWTLSFENGNQHPAPFPTALVKRCILACSRDNDIVYDPFMGSGTTAKAAHQLGRRWLGSEISAEYVELANKRLEPYLAQASLFAASPTVEQVAGA